MSDTPRSFCPECHVGEVLDPRTQYLEHCTDHPRADLVGLDDKRAMVSAKGPGMTEMDGAETRAACDAIHRGARAP